MFADGWMNEWMHEWVDGEVSRKDFNQGNDMMKFAFWENIMVLKWSWKIEESTS